MAQLPNLSQLRVADNTGNTGVKLFQYLAEQRANKGDCVRHVDDNYKEGKPDPPRPPAPDAHDSDARAATMTERRRQWDAKKAQYDADANDYQLYKVDCGVDGYLMYKKIPDAADASTLAADYLEQPLQLTIGEKVVKLETLNKNTPRIPGSANDARRKRDFEDANGDWVPDRFDNACFRSDELGSIEWSGYGKELAGATDWYYLHDQEQKRGHLFLQLFDSQEMKVGKHMPTDGDFAGRYLYIGLVCAKGSGLAKDLMSIAYAASRALGCDGIALATMTNSAGFYFSQGFQFMDKVDGSPIDVARYTEQRMLPNGRPRTMLLENYDPDDPRAQKRARDDADAAALERAGRRASQRRRTLARLSYFA